MEIETSAPEAGTTASATEDTAQHDVDTCEVDKSKNKKRASHARAVVDSLRLLGGIPSPDSREPRQTMVLALDINATIVEGDSMHQTQVKNLTAPAKDLMKLTKSSATAVSEPETSSSSSCSPPSRRKAESMRTPPTPSEPTEEDKLLVSNMKLGIVLYTFGSDYRKAVDLLGEWGLADPEPTNYYFIARSADTKEIWAFPMHTEHMSRYVDFETYKNPVILDSPIGEDPNAMPSIASLPTWDPLSGFPQGEAYRFSGLRDFSVFVDLIIRKGHVVLRACYEPQNDMFRSREQGGRKGYCKVLSCSHHMLAFDDNPDDWELFDITGATLRCEKSMDSNENDMACIVKVVSPEKAQKAPESQESPTQLCNAMKEFIEKIKDKSKQSL